MNPVFSLLSELPPLCLLQNMKQFVVTFSLLVLISSCSASSHNCSVEGTFCIQAYADRSYTFYVTEKTQSRGLISFVLTRISARATTPEYLWVVTMNEHFEHLDSYITFFDDHQNGNIYRTRFTASKEVPITASFQKLGSGKWETMNNGTFREHFGVHRRNRTHNMISFNTSKSLDSLLELEKNPRRVKISVNGKWNNGTSLTETVLQTKEFVELFSGNLTHLTPGYETDLGGEQLSSTTTGNLTDTTNKAATEKADPVVIGVLGAIIIVLLLAIIAVIWALCKRKPRKQLAINWAD
jgi:hypothetical protein